MNEIKPNNFNDLTNNIYNTHQVLTGKAQQSINRLLTVRNWIVGYYIKEYEQNGRDRAEYGEQIVKKLSSSLKEKGLKGFSTTYLKLCRTFYSTYIEIGQSVIDQFKTLADDREASYVKNFPLRPRAGEAGLKTLRIDKLLSKLSFTHFIQLIKVSDPTERTFYEDEAMNNNWSIRELKRAIDTSLAYRFSKSTDKLSIIAKIKDNQPVTNAEIIKDPYLLEFLGLPEKTEFTENDLETSILNNLQRFLIELGTGFCFEARQKRITFDNNHYYIDLVFYHRILKCHVIVELKIGEYSHADAGQMNLYLNYYKKNEMLPDDNPPIGLILCSNKNDTLVEYTTEGMNQMFVSQYLLKLPDPETLKRIIKDNL